MTLHRQRSAAAGFTLIEVLVSLVILGIGLLGIAKLVLYSVRANDSAYLRTQATTLAYGILDNMRANALTAQGLNYNVALGAVAAPGNLCNLVATPCSNVALAQFDIYAWKQQLLASLPNGDGSITTVANAQANTTGNLYTVVVTVQ